MKSWIKYLLIIIAVVAVVYGGVVSLMGRQVPMGDFVAVTSGAQGSVMAAWYEGDDTVLAMISNTGTIRRSISYDSVQGDEMYSIRGIASGSDDTAYLLQDTRNAYTGELVEQQLVILDFSGITGKIQKSFVLTDENENYEYGWIQVSGETITLIATDRFQEHAIRRTYEYGSLLVGTLNIKNTRTYPLESGEGIYLAMSNNTDLVYISDSGKIFCADEESVTEIYPARTLETLMYPTFLAYAESGYVYFGEHESGNIVKLNLETGGEEIVMAGGSALLGASMYTPSDFIQVSMSNLNVYTAVVNDYQSQEYRILSSYDGMVSVIDEMTYSLQATIVKWLISTVLAAVCLLAVFLVIWIFLSGIRSGRTIMGRLIYVSIPLVVAVMALFEMIAYNYYQDAIQENFEKQVMDEGNMLTALFGQESFQDVEYPYDYTSTAYTYLAGQIQIRDLYTRILYYEENEIYLGVDANTPCFYPADILMNQGAKNLYETAALTGEQVIGYVADQLGERLVCITPVGGASGQTVYLMENGLFTSNIDSYMTGYIRNFTIICVAFSLMMLILLAIFFYRILTPIHDIRWAMSHYVEGDPESRVEVTSEDELAQIGRVFNKMADDAAVQVHSLERMTEIYYRFIPKSTIALLKKENLADLTLGSSVTGEFPVMQATLSRWAGAAVEPDTVDRFFGILHEFADANGLVSIADKADASIVRLVGTGSVDILLNTALAVLARLDAENAKRTTEEELHVSFLIHRGTTTFCICGEENRYIPALFVPELDGLLKNKEFLDQVEKRILMSAVAYKQLEQPAHYAGRYIGQITIGNDLIGIYDMYDDSGAEELNWIKNTESSFGKAIALFERGFYYEAKNLFTLVLRENPKDLVAKYYIFQCERLQEQK